MLLPDRYNYGCLFALSGIDGINEHKNDFCGMLMPAPVTVRFDAEIPVTLSIPVPDDTAFDFVLGDMIKGRGIELVFVDCNSVAGRSEYNPEITAEGINPVIKDNCSIIAANGFFYALLKEGLSFSLARAINEETAIEKARDAIKADTDGIITKRLDYYRKMPPCPKPEYEKLYYKCLEVNRVNVYSPQDGIDCRFTTPDRLPHRHMWLWDSMFHAMAISRYDTQLAKEAIWAVLQCQRDDGFIPHMMKSRDDVSSITQPQVVAWAVLTVYNRDGDMEFLRKCAPKIDRFLDWFIRNRDDNSNCLLEWDMNFDSGNCRCDESGMDNSPRFDVSEKVDAVDCNAFMVNDCNCLAEIYRILGDEENFVKYKATADEFSWDINNQLWDDESGIYCDRTMSGNLTGILTCASFLPMFAGLCPMKRAKRMVEMLEDPEKFATAFPVPSIARDHELYGADMWRGCVWINFNYFIIKGLRFYGYGRQADRLADITLKTANRWFEETGNIFEFYDAEDKIAPWHLNRKGKQPETPDYRIKMHAITDYNWTASFLQLIMAEKEK